MLFLGQNFNEKGNSWVIFANMEMFRENKILHCREKIIKIFSFQPLLEARCSLSRIPDLSGLPAVTDTFLLFVSFITKSISYLKNSLGNIMGL